MIEVGFDMREFVRVAEALGKSERNLRFVAAYAMTQSLREARTAEQAAMRSVFDRPTPYALNALQVVPARKDPPFLGELRWKEFGGTPAWKFLTPEVEGGKRRRKASERRLQAAGILGADEYIVPSKHVKLDAYGNVPGSLMQRILSAIGARNDASQNTGKRRGSKQMAYFVLRGHGKARDGIYFMARKPGKRSKGDTKSGVWAIPILLFVKSPSYKARFPYRPTADRVIRSAFRRHFVAGFNRFIVNDIRGA